ncbi:hypothetical protein ACNKHW_05710 [Shigella flexneri]
MQTEKPLKTCNAAVRWYPYDEGSCKAYGREMNPEMKKNLQPSTVKPQDQGVFNVILPDIIRCRKCGIVAGLPDASGRGRIISDLPSCCAVQYRLPDERQIRTVHFSAG